MTREEANTVIATGDGAYYKIKALEQETCEDCVSRQAVIEAIYDMEILKYRIDLEKVIKELPSVAIPSAEPKTGWIPVSERLPEEGVDVLACFYTGEGNYKMMVSRRSDYNYWSGVGRTADMVAWMPLPPSYHGK